MTVRNIGIMVFSAIAAVSVCQAGGLRPASSSDYDYGYSSGGGTSSSDDENDEERETLTLEKGDEISFAFEEDFPEEIGGLEVLTEFLPDGVPLEWNGKKLKAPKAGKIKYSKSEEAFVDKKDSNNPSGLSAKYSKKKGTISGSFKVYVAKSETKLKSYKAKFSGKLGDTMKVYVKGKLVATAVVE